MGVYASNGNGSRIMRGKAPSLLNHSILTLLCRIHFYGKDINAAPLMDIEVVTMVMMDLHIPVRLWLDG